ncbi:MAG: hypothetical protein KIS87_08160 [Phycisphaeraceae bacterium]|nr:hypothetical protein [Phycisphaeraceae bacterium]
MGRPRAFRSAVHGSDPEAVALAFQELAGLLDDPIASMAVTAGAEGEHGTNVRRFTAQAKDRLREDWAERFLVVVWLAGTAFGVPDAADAVAFQAGTVVLELVADAAWLVLTDSAGRLVFDATIVGAATRHVNAVVVGVGRTAGGFAWT